MKLIIVGASGFVATELIRQSIRLPTITTIIALARRQVSVPPDLAHDPGSSKLRSVTISDYDQFSDDVKKELAGADACIWTVAITPTKSKGVDFKEVTRVCQTCTLVGLKAIVEANGSRTGSQPLRFMYMSGVAAERDASKKPWFMPEYSLMRGETENQVLKYAAEHKDTVEVCVAKPGLIKRTGDILQGALAVALKVTGVVPNVSVVDISAAMLQQVVNGFEKEPLLNEDLVSIGQKAVAEHKSSS